MLPDIPEIRFFPDKVWILIFSGFQFTLDPVGCGLDPNLLGYGKDPDFVGYGLELIWIRILSNMA